MRKISLLCMSVLVVLNAHGVGGKGGSASSDPSPLVSTQGGTVIIDVSGSDLSGDVYLYSWAFVGSEEVPATTWDGAISSKYKMTASGSTYSLQIESLQSFFNLSDAQLSQLTKIGVIARNSAGAQTVDLFLNVSQAPKVYYSGGEGTVSSPYIISKEQDLKDLAATSVHWGKAFKMSANVTLSGTFSGIGDKGTPFSGSFDGNGYTIKGLQMGGSNDATGLFPYINGASVKLLGVAGVNVSGKTFVGALVGVAQSGTVERCYVSGAVTGNGICVGGMVGVNENATFQNCYSTCAVSNINDNATGGFAGKNLGTIKNAYATGSVNGREFLGGFIGANYATVTNCAAINNPLQSAQSFVARFGGNNNTQNNGTNNISWASIRLNNASNWTACGDQGTQKSGAELKQQTSFSSGLGWDFSSVWEWDSANYPKLAQIAGQLSTYPSDFTETAIEETAASADVKVYPNPVEDFIYINSTCEISAVQLFDVTGKLVKLENISGSEARIDAVNLSGGIYILKVYAGNEILYMGKIIKK